MIWMNCERVYVEYWIDKPKAKYLQFENRISVENFFLLIHVSMFYDITKQMHDSSWAARTQKYHTRLIQTFSIIFYPYFLPFNNFTILSPAQCLCNIFDHFSLSLCNSKKKYFVQFSVHPMLTNPFCIQKIII